MLKTDGYLNVAEVAQKVGYTNAISFSRSFKKQFGVSPYSGAGETLTPPEGKKVRRGCGSQARKEEAPGGTLKDADHRHGCDAGHIGF